MGVSMVSLREQMNVLVMGELKGVSMVTLMEQMKVTLMDI